MGALAPSRWMASLVAKPGFQAWAARFPLTRGKARRDGAALFSLVQGFVQSQALRALIELDLLERLRGGPKTAEQLAPLVGVDADKLGLLLQAGAGMKLLSRKRGARYALARQGAALLGVPGLDAMILHHDVLYRDMADPVALLKGEVDTELAGFWPYVFGAQGAVDEDVLARYSELMSQSQQIVAADTLELIPLKGIERLMDVGGGTGAFLSAVAARYPALDMVLFDLPDVAEEGARRLTAQGFGRRVTVQGGSFRDDPLPRGADAISLIRVLYDHADETVEALLASARGALPEGGKLLISEPMSGGATPDPVGDVYFAFYTLAMRTGRARSADDITALCQAAGFRRIAAPRPRRSFVTTALLFEAV